MTAALQKCQGFHISECSSSLIMLSFAIKTEIGRFLGSVIEALMRRRDHHPAFDRIHN